MPVVASPTAARFEYVALPIGESPSGPLNVYAAAGWELVAAAPGHFDASGVFHSLGFTLILSRPIDAGNPPPTCIATPSYARHGSKMAQAQHD